MQRLVHAFLALAAVMLVLAPDADAQEQGRKGGEARHARHERKADRLGLDQAQREQVRLAAQQHRDGLQALRDRARTAHEALRQVLDAAPADSAAVRTAAQALEAARTELAVARGLRKADVSAVLTPEQRGLAKSARDLRRGQKAERHELRQQERSARKEQRAAGSGPR